MQKKRWHGDEKSGEEAATRSLITDHLAPYNLPTLARVHARGNLSLEVAVQFQSIAKHDYWPEIGAIFSEGVVPDGQGA